MPPKKQNKKVTRSLARKITGSAYNIPPIIADFGIPAIVDLVANDAYSPETSGYEFSSIAAFFAYQRRLRRSVPFGLSDKDIAEYLAIFSTMFHRLQVNMVEAWGNPGNSSKPTPRMSMNIYPTYTGGTCMSKPTRIDGTSSADESPYLRSYGGKAFFFEAGYPVPSAPAGMPRAGVHFDEVTRLRFHITVY